jgi:branched-chain amino acid transport system substrate-binding protein
MPLFRRIPISLFAATAMIAGMAAPALAQSGCELKIGAIGPMSGPAAQWGLAMEGAAKLAAAEANAAGGLKVGNQTCKVTVSSYDSKYTAEGAAAGANSFASQGIKFIIGPVGSPEMTGIKPVAMRNGQLVFGDSFAKDAIGPKWPTVFHLGPGPSGWGSPVVDAALKTFPGIKSVAVIAPNDQGGTDIASVDADIYKKHGLATHEEYYQRGTTNFAPIITRMLAENPGAVDTASSPPGDAGVIVKQLRQAGFTGPIGRLGGPGTEEIIRVAGGIDVLKDFYYYEDVPTEDPKVTAMRDEYKKVVGSDPPQNTNLLAWTPGARLLLKAISEAGTITDAKKVSEVLARLPPEDPNMGKGIWTGQKFFGINHELFFPFGVGIIKNGKDMGVQRAEPIEQ